MTPTPLLPAPSAPSRRQRTSLLLGGATLVVTWLFLWSWFAVGVLEPLARLPWSA